MPVGIAVPVAGHRIITVPIGASSRGSIVVVFARMRQRVKPFLRMKFDITAIVSWHTVQSLSVVRLYSRGFIAMRNLPALARNRDHDLGGPGARHDLPDLHDLVEPTESL